MADDPASAALEEERAILAAAVDAADQGAWRIAAELYGTLKVGSLVAAAEAVLEQHQRVNRGDDLPPICGTCHKGFWPCPTYQAITRALVAEPPA